MSSVYVVIENAEPYKNVYTSFTLAQDAVKEKYAMEIIEQTSNDHTICTEIDLLEDSLSGKTYLYVEKGIHIHLYL